MLSPGPRTCLNLRAARREEPAPPVAAALALALLGGPAQADGPRISWSLDDALKQVDRQADDFKSAPARVEVVRHYLDGNELSRETGTVFMDKSGKIRLDADAPNNRTYLVLKGDMYIHYPDEKRVEVYSLSRRNRFLASSRSEQVTLTYAFVARNLELNPDLFSTRWPKGTEKQKVK